MDQAEENPCLYSSLAFEKVWPLEKNTGIHAVHSKPKEPTNLWFLTMIASWWFQPSWKIWVKMGIFPKFRGENEKYFKPPPREALGSARPPLGRKNILRNPGIPKPPPSFGAVILGGENGDPRYLPSSSTMERPHRILIFQGVRWIIYLSHQANTHTHTHTIHVWYISLHLVDFHAECR